MAKNIKQLKQEDSLNLFGKKFRINFKGKPVNRFRIYNFLWVVDARQSRGSGLIAQTRIGNISQISQWGVIALLFKLPPWSAPLFVLIYYAMTFFIGLWDENKWGYWHFENEYNQTYKVNPYQRRIEQRQIRIEKALDKMLKGGVYIQEEDIYG